MIFKMNRFWILSVVLGLSVASVTWAGSDSRVGEKRAAIDCEAMTDERQPSSEKTAPAPKSGEVKDAKKATAAKP